ncbi:MAG TPA: hypothetical protein VF553_12235 [Pyrinomonadaceae bacterium]
MRVIIEDFGARVASVWEGLSSESRSLIVGALQSTSATAVNSRLKRAHSYDARADWELSRLLAALDERAAEAGVSLNDEQATSLRRMAETTACVLQSQTQSAEVFAQLVERAHRQHDFARIDALADALPLRFAPSELCEVARSAHPVVRALAHEALAQAPTSTLISLLTDPVDAAVARDALECQAIEYGSEEARHLINALDQVEEIEDDL